MTRTRITLYGGVNEIGGNKFLLEEGEERLMLDFGTSIGARNEFFEMPFLTPRSNSVLRDLLRLGLLPDVDGVYREDLLAVAKAATDRDLPESAEAYRARHRRPFLDGVLLTHAHVDHFQDLTFLDPSIPVFCTPTTRRMIEAIEDVKNASAESEVVEARLRHVETAGARSSFPGARKVEKTPVRRVFVELPEDETRRVGAFEVTPVPVDHSVPGACAFLVKTPSGKRVFYTGDVRFHGRLMDRTSRLLKVARDLAPDVMLSEGTRMESDAADGEADVERDVAALAKEAGGLVVAEFGWKDTTRFDTLQRVAEMTDRTLLVDPRLAFLLHRLDERPDVPSSRIEGYHNVRAYRRRQKSLLDEPSDYDKHEIGYEADWGASGAALKAARDAGDEAYLARALAHYRNGVTAAAVRERPHKFIVHLSFFSMNELFDLDPGQGARWIRCATEPYSDEMASDLAKQVRWLEHFGVQHNVRPKKGSDDPDILHGTTHISGHGARPDLEKLVRSAGASVLVPIHTTEKHLDRFDGWCGDLRTFRQASWRKAGRGECVVEL